MYLADIFVCAISLAGLPALSIPVGRSEGLPVGRAAHRAVLRGRAHARGGGARSSGSVAADRGGALMAWETVIGLEVHVQLRTRTKMFCGCRTTFGDPPNTNVCPVCLGLPGALPVPNAEAVRLATRAALALGCDVHATSVFARKNYFYPDLPKGYQISQFDQPLATGGRVAFESPERGRIERRHHPPARGGGRGQADARPVPREDGGRPQPRRHAARRDRERARPPRRRPRRAPTSRRCGRS